MAKLDRLTVQGFKSIQLLEDFELRGLNVLIGPNGAGKSNFLSLFRMLDHLSRQRLQLFIRQEGGPDALLFGGRRRSSSLSVELSFDGGRWRCLFSLEPAASRLVFADEWIFPGLTESSMNAGEAFRTVKGGTQWAGGHEEVRLAGFSQGAFATAVVPGMQHWRVFHFSDMSTGRTSRVRLSHPVRDNLRLQQDAANLAPFLRRLCEHHPDHYRRIVETVRLAAPFFGDFIHRREDEDTDEKMMELEWSHADDPDSVLGPFQLSDGTLRFVCLATLLLQPTDLQPGVILIDEPELGLHPYALTLLAEMLQHASDERQIIVSTQSADLVNELDPKDVVVVDRKDGASTFTRLDRSDLMDWLEDYALGDLWKMNVLGGRPRP